MFSRIVLQVQLFMTCKKNVYKRTFWQAGLQTHDDISHRQQIERAEIVTIRMAKRVNNPNYFSNSRCRTGIIDLSADIMPSDYGFN